MKLRDDVNGVTRSRLRIAPAESGTIVRANPSSLSQLRLDLLPIEPVVPATALEHDSRRARAGAVEMHLVAVDQIELSRDGIALRKAMDIDSVIRGTRQHAEQHHEQNAQKQSFHSPQSMMQQRT